MAMVTANASGKCIISGEHSVVYGCPALVVAADFFATTTIKQLPGKDRIIFKLPNFVYSAAFTFEELLARKQQLQQRYADFVDAKVVISAVLQHPVELLQFIFITFVEEFSSNINSDLEITVQSNIPVGCGLGSSAAVIISLLRALTELYACNGQDDKLLACARHSENLQHGYSSGLDLYIALYGGCILLHNATITTRQMPRIPYCLANTGRPLTTTGECVANVAKYFLEQKIRDDFTAVTLAIDEAIQNNNLVDVQYYVRKNHQLLKYIGVVPQQVCEFIETAEKQGMAAKICGAGAVAGGNAGVIMLVGEKEKMATLLERYKMSVRELIK